MYGTIHLLCGKICSGKSYYCHRLMTEKPALLLSCDELVKTILPGDLGEAHDEILARVKTYLFRKAAEATACGMDVILDWGFWTKKDRTAAAEYFRSRGIPLLWHYLAVTNEDWQKNIAERNAAILRGEHQLDYYVDEGLLSKLAGLFEEPEREEIDIWVENRRVF